MIKSLENKTYGKILVELEVYFHTERKRDISSSLGGLVGGNNGLKLVFIFTWKQIWIRESDFDLIDFFLFFFFDKYLWLNHWQKLCKIEEFISLAIKKESNPFGEN